MRSLSEIIQEQKKQIENEGIVLKKSVKDGQKALHSGLQNRRLNIYNIL